MFWNRVRQVIYAALTVIGLIWTNYYLVQFTVATKGDFTASNLLNFDLPIFIEQVWANPASSFVAVDLTIGLLLVITFMVTEGRRLKLRVWGLYIALDVSDLVRFWLLPVYVRARAEAGGGVGDGSSGSRNLSNLSIACAKGLSTRRDTMPCGVCRRG
jgi:hypothetical protein